MADYRLSPTEGLIILNVESVVDYELMYAAAAEELIKLRRDLRRAQRENRVLLCRLSSNMFPCCVNCCPVLNIVDPRDSVLADGDLSLRCGRLAVCPVVCDEIYTEV